MDKTEIIQTLDDLAEISRDGEKGFLAAAKDTHDATLKSIFQTAAERCANGARELESQIVVMGGTPSRSGSVPGALHRFWTNLKALATARSDKAILEEVERGEDVAESAYQSAMAKPLPPQIRAIVDRQYRGVKQNHARVRELRNAA